MIVNTHYSYCGGRGVPGERATIVVTAPTGSTVTATLGSTTLRASEVSGTWTFNVREFGVWTINASKGSESASTTVNVTEDTTYEVSLAYTVIVTITGSGGTRKRATVTINGTVYSSAATVNVSTGSIILLTVSTTSGYARIFVNDVQVARTNTANQPATYNLTAGNNPITITLSGDTAGYITVTY